MISLARIRKLSKYLFPFIVALLIVFVVGSALFNRPPKASEKGPEPFLDTIAVRHIEERHIDLETFTAKSKFVEGTDYRSLIDEAYENCQSFRKEHGRYIYDYDAGRRLGTKGESSARLVTEDSGRVVTFYPFFRKTRGAFY